MIDWRFYSTGWAPTAADIAREVEGAVVRGDATRAPGSLAAIASASSDDLTFLESAEEAGPTAAAVCLTTEVLAELLPDDTTVITCRSPRAAFARVAMRMVVLRELEAGQLAVHPSATVSATAVMEPGCVIGADAAIGDGVRIGANTIVGPGVQIGRNSRIGQGCSLKCALIGDGVSILPGAVIGETGFGLAASGGGLALSPHFGRVVIQNGVSIGANSCVDRGLLEDTVLGEGTHIDNLCHIGHNSKIGSGVVMAAFAGVSGSVHIEDNVQFGGRVGVKDHIHIGRGARIAAGSAVLKDVPAGDTHAGYPAKPARTWMRELAWLATAAQKRSSDK